MKSGFGMLNKESMIKKAQEILVENDLGGYTIPTHGLYPFQWNWDAAITALGWAKFDEPRAWLELVTLFKGQWDNGLLPHIVFHEHSDTYFPGADVWGAVNEVKSSAISQPPVLATVAKIMFEECLDKANAKEELNSLLPQIIDWHIWWYRDRDPENTGLVVSYHPWESGMDNSPAWDDALDDVPVVDWEYTRLDTDHIDGDQRPHKSQYDRYLYLVDFYKKCQFDAKHMYENCPYKVQDISIISILHKATKDLVELCELCEFDHPNVDTLKQKLVLTESAISTLWHEPSSSFLSKNTINNQWCEEITSAVLLPLYGELATKEQAQKIHTLLDEWVTASPYAIASTHPSSDKLEPKRYWRGPVWLHINWMIALGAETYGFNKTSEEIQKKTAELLNVAGFFEYFDCNTGEGCGGDDFSWTAAIALHWIY